MKLYRSNSITHRAYQTAQSTWYANLTPYQQAAVYLYADSGYRSINHCLRHGKPLTDMDAEFTQQLDAAIATATPELTPRPLYRAVKKLNFDPQPGETVTFPYFASTTTDPHQLFKFVDPENPIIFEIETRFGAKLSDMHPEFEFLLPRDSTFLIEEILAGVTWHAEYPETDHSRAIHNATVIRMRQEDNHDPRGETADAASRAHT